MNAQQHIVLRGRRPGLLRLGAVEQHIAHELYLQRVKAGRFHLAYGLCRGAGALRVSGRAGADHACISPVAIKKIAAAHNVNIRVRIVRLGGE